MKLRKKRFAVLLTAIFIFCASILDGQAIWADSLDNGANQSHLIGGPAAQKKGLGSTAIAQVAGLPDQEETEMPPDRSRQQETAETTEINTIAASEYESAGGAENKEEEGPEESSPEDVPAIEDASEEPVPATEAVPAAEGGITAEDAISGEESTEIIPEMMELLDETSMQLDIAQSAVTISEAGYSLNGGEEIAFSGDYYILQSSGSPTANPLVVENGVHSITLENVQIDRQAEGGAAFEIGSEADVELTLVGENDLTSGINYAGIHLYVKRELGKEARLSIAGGGSLSACGGTNAAGIGGGYEASNGQVTINGGTIYAQGGAGGAGIGGGNNSSSYKVNDCDGGVITITGGSITAYGGDSAAGIGGGNHGDGGEITITGGVIERAQGGGGGAGIGSGLGSHVKSDKGPGYYTGGHITLSGEYLIKEALGGGNAAGIGGGMYADSGKLVITGGHIELARGGAGTAGSRYHGAAGIGAGYQGHCDVFIRNAHIEQAVGSFSGAGIGSGATANNGRRENDSVARASNVFICSSYIDLAQGGEYGGAGIGGGASCDFVTVTLCGHRIVAKGGSGGAGVGSGVYDENYSYYCKTEAVVHIKCGALDAEGDGGEDVGHGVGNDEGEILVNMDEVDLTETPSIPEVESDGYEGYYDGLAYGIKVEIANAFITYTEVEEGPYEEEKPMYTEVGEYLTYYQADKAYFTFYGSETVVIKPLDDGGQDGGEPGGSSKSGRRRTPVLDAGEEAEQPAEESSAQEAEEPTETADPGETAGSNETARQGDTEDPAHTAGETGMPGGTADRSMDADEQMDASGSSVVTDVAADPANDGIRDWRLNPQTGLFHLSAAGFLLLASTSLVVVYLLRCKKR